MAKQWYLALKEMNVHNVHAMRWRRPDQVHAGCRGYVTIAEPNPDTRIGFSMLLSIQSAAGIYKAI